MKPKLFFVGLAVHSLLMLYSPSTTGAEITDYSQSLENSEVLVTETLSVNNTESTENSDTADEASPKAIAPGETPVTEMLLTDETESIETSETADESSSKPITPGEIPVTEMLLTDETESIETSETSETSETAEIEDELEETTAPFFSFLDDHQQDMSNYLKQYILGVDNFFSESASVDGNTGSYIRITLESLWKEGKSAEFDGGLSLKLRLPNTQKKLKLVLTNDIEEQKGALEKATGGSTSLPEGENKSFFAGFERSKVKGNWKLKPSVGLRVRSPLDLYFRVRADRNISFKKWLLSLNESLYWFDSTGFGSDTTVRWDRPLSNKLLFRSSSFLRYTDLLDYFEMSQTFSVTQTLSHKRAITYKIGAFGESEPSLHATTYLLNALYRNNIHKDYLFLDIQPQLLFERENEFKGRTEFFIRLQLYYRG